MTVTNVLLIADTHLGPGQAGRLIERLGAELADVDAVLHAGDITDRSVLEALGASAPGAPVHAVEGNNDHGLPLPDRLTVDIGGCTVAMVHDSGAAAGRAARLRRWFPDADVVVFGHSHLPWHETDVRADGHVQHHVNPGSAMLRRRAPTCTVARLVIDAGTVTSVTHITVG
ncbi:MAG: metallophosphoesterase family protein [Ilumatobacteraceae bacterium]